MATDRAKLEKLTTDKLFEKLERLHTQISERWTAYLRAPATTRGNIARIRFFALQDEFRLVLDVLKTRLKGVEG